MKKILYATTALLITVSSLLLSGCQDPIFYKVRKEVALEDASVSGDIQGIVRYHNSDDDTDYLVLSNGNILYKDQDNNSYGNWSAYESSDSSTLWKPVIDDTDTDGDPVIFHVYQLAVGTSGTTEYLYALGGVLKYDSDEGENMLDTRYLYYTDSIGGDWTVVDTDDYSSSMASSSTVVRLFGTNSIDPANRSAYININGTAYKLSAGTIGSEVTTDTLDDTDSTDARSAVYFDSDVQFFHSIVSDTNETGSEDDATYIYYADGGVLYYSTDAGTWKSVDPSIDDIDSMAITSDYILLGTDSGIEHVTNSDGVPGSSTQDFSTNADSTLSSSYVVQALLAVDPANSETEGTLYGTLIVEGYSSSSSADRDDEGLWAYYPTRGNWNRE